jgi:hypothetical protein
MSSFLPRFMSNELPFFTRDFNLRYETACQFIMRFNTFSGFERIEVERVI